MFSLVSVLNCWFDQSGMASVIVVWLASHLPGAASVGMAPKENASIINDTSLFHEGLIVSDVIYNPEETQLLKLAKEHGCHTFNGLYMLLYQGAEAFKIWTGKEMPIEPIKEKYFDR